MKFSFDCPKLLRRFQFFLAMSVAGSVCLFVGVGTIIAHFQGYWGALVFLLTYGLVFRWSLKGDTDLSLCFGPGFMYVDRNRICRWALLIFVIFCLWDLVFSGELVRVIPDVVLWLVVPWQGNLILGASR